MPLPLAYNRDDTTIRIVHFGPGAFFRAHQASYIDDLLATDPRWAISAVALKTSGVRNALAPQDGLYTLVELGETTRFRVSGAIRELLVASEDADRVADRLASPDTRLVTLTVTEKGYCLKGDGTLDLDHPDIRHDLAEPDRPVSVIGWLVEGLSRRRAAGLPPFTTLSCDNLPSNGSKLKATVVRLAQARDPALARWIAAEARFPCSMVDSITPATDDALRARVLAETGLEDAWPIQRETFTQWVLEDDLGPDAPDLASVGVTLTHDVEAWEAAKLRLLNGAHSTLAYVGLLRGHETVRGAMADAELASFVRAMMLEDIAPTLHAPAGLDIPAYVEALLARFRNPAIAHRLSQVAWDGSQKLPIRILGTVSDAMAAGRPVDRLIVAMAAWMRFVERQARAGVAITDPMAEKLVETGLRGGLAAFLALEAVFPPALANNPAFAGPLRNAYDAMQSSSLPA
ncbi:MAG: mannitol dehydrogenase family protein [Caulobacterales bacterium]|nr:mannitol dehydrogenase family protein [Caulobacterales bacterium]